MKVRIDPGTLKGCRYERMRVNVKTTTSHTNLAHSASQLSTALLARNERTVTPTERQCLRRVSLVDSWEQIAIITDGAEGIYDQHDVRDTGAGEVAHADFDIGYSHPGTSGIGVPVWPMIDHCLRSAHALRN